MGCARSPFIGGWGGAAAGGNAWQRQLRAVGVAGAPWINEVVGICRITNQVEQILSHKCCC